MAKRQSRVLRGTYGGGLRSAYSSSSSLLSCAVSEPTVAPDVAKLVMLGDAGVGKTSLVLRLCHDTFDDSSTPTLGVAFSTKDAKRDDGSSIRFQVWDTAGQEQYHSLASLYYRSAHAAVVAFDVTSKSSFKSVRTWIHELSQLGPPDVVIIVVATKTDLAEQRIVTETEARAYAESRGVVYIETSAKTRSNVSEIFEALSIQLHGRGGLGLARSGRRSASACTEESNNDVGHIVLENIGKTRRRRLPCFAD